MEVQVYLEFQDLLEASVYLVLPELLVRQALQEDQELQDLLEELVRLALPVVQDLQVPLEVPEIPEFRAQQVRQGAAVR